MLKINFTKMCGLVPVIIQEINTKQVLMLGFMNQAAWQKTRITKKVCFYSRTRKKLWTKGETSGNYLLVKKIYLDCDNDTLLILVKLAGQSVCHTGQVSCFYQKFN
ncbi:MAG: phosphoribosyl-AMP cyclohydrolase [Candidatus Buchananbacteria bacterium]